MAPQGRKVLAIGKTRRFGRAPKVVKKNMNSVEDADATSRIGIVGLGAVGNALKHVLEFYYDCKGYDLLGGDGWGEILETDIVFVCVGTPEGDGGRLDGV